MEKKQSLAVRVYTKTQQAFFDIILDLLKEKTTGTHSSIITIMIKGS